MEKEARCRRGQGGHPGQAEEGAECDCIGHLGQQGPEDQAAKEPLPGGDSILCYLNILALKMDMLWG